MNKNILVLVAAIILLLNFSCNNQKGKQIQAIKSNEPSFVLELTNLKEGKSDSLAVDFFDRIKRKEVFVEEIEIDSRDRYDNSTNGHIENLFDDYHSIKKEDVLKITDNYILILLKSKSFEIRAATFKLDGKPIESILLFNHFGNNEYKVYRTFSFYEDIEYKYDFKLNQFVFTDLRYDTEWIEFPTKGKDIITYEEESIIGINEKGEFYLVNRTTKNTAGTEL